VWVLIGAIAAAVKLFGGAYIGRSMSMEPALGFVLYVNNRAAAFGSSLGLAQKLAERFVCDEPPPRLRIESVAALAPSQIWNYDYAAGLWGEAPVGHGDPYLPDSRLPKEIA
jgi:hypothetical protein